MPYDGLESIAVDNFGGLNTLSNATDIPYFMSPDCQNVEFVPGRVQKRSGTSIAFTNGISTGNINYTKSYQQPNGSVQNLAVDSLGTLFYENVTFGSTFLVTGSLLQNLTPNSVTLFSREWLALGDGKQGQDVPRQYNGTNVYRVSQDGPGAGPVVTDYNQIFAMNTGVAAQVFQNPSRAITAISQSGNLVTVTTATSPLVTSITGTTILDGEMVVIAGVTPSDYNGTFPVTPIPGTSKFTYSLGTNGLVAGSGGTAQSQAAAYSTKSPFFNNWQNVLKTGETFLSAGFTPTAYNGAALPIVGFFAYLQGGITFLGIILNIGVVGTANGSGGTLTLLGNIVAGVHQVSVQFLTIEGYLTAPSRPVSFTANGNRMLFASQIPIGPANIIARYVSITPISSGQFFYIPSGVGTVFSTIINDNTTTTAIFNFGDSDLLNGVNVNAAFELLTLGEVTSFAEYNSRLVTWGQTNKIQNFVNLTFDGGFSQDANVCPLGWTPDPTNYLGGGKAASAVTGDAYAITGDGVHTTQGLITQSASLDYLGNAILSPNTTYTASARFSKTNILFGAQVIIRLSAASTGYSQSLTVNLQTQVNIGTFGKFTAALSVLPASIPNDLIVSVFATNLSNGDSVYVDEIEFYPTLNPVETSVIRFSDVEDPESFNGLTGFQQPAQENGQAVRNCFILRDFFYIVKERSIFVTRDDGQTEPNAWEIDEVSSKIGTPSPRGVGLGDEWAVIAGQSGLWMFTGGQIWQQNNLLSNEIQPTWDSINWKLGHLVDVKVDTTKKRVYVNVPLGASATQNNTILVVDYTEGWGDPAQNNGIGRKWTLWTLQANAINLCLQNDNSQVLYVGNNFNAGAIYKLDPAILNDYGNGLTPIDSYWQSGYFKNPTRLNFSYIVANAVGSGTLQMVLRLGDQGSFYPIRGWQLDPRGLKNMERQIQKQGYRMAIKFEVTGLTDDFMVQGFSMFVRESLWAPIRGINA